MSRLVTKSYGHDGGTFRSPRKNTKITIDESESEVSRRLTSRSFRKSMKNRRNNPPLLIFHPSRMKKQGEKDGLAHVQERHVAAGNPSLLECLKKGEGKSVACRGDLSMTVYTCARVYVASFWYTHTHTRAERWPRAQSKRVGYIPGRARLFERKKKGRREEREVRAPRDPCATVLHSLLESSWPNLTYPRWDLSGGFTCHLYTHLGTFLSPSSMPTPTGNPRIPIPIPVDRWTVHPSFPGHVS